MSYKYSSQVIVEPWDPAVNKAMQKINQIDPSLLKNVTKIVVHPGGGSGQLGHVESGQGKDPHVIHIFKDRVREHVMRNANATTKKTLTPQELEQAIVDGLTEVLAHESGHIGKTAPVGKQFFGEPEAELEAKKMMSRIHPASYSLKLSKRAAIEMACPYCQENVSHIKPEKTPAGLFKMLTCPGCKKGFYPQDAMVSVKELPKEKIEWNMPEKGWWAIFIFDWGYGFVDSESKAKLMKDRLIKMFVEQGLNGIEKILPDLAFGLNEYPRDVVMQAVSKRMLGDEPKISNKPYEEQRDLVEYDRIESEANKESSKDIDSILNGTGEFQKQKRREIIEGIIGISKAYPGYEPPKEAVVSGGFPTTDNFINANDEVINDPDLNKERSKNARESRRLLSNKFEGIINTTVKKLKMKELGVDPSKMCDDAKLASKKKSK